MRTLLRPADIFHACMASFIAGAFAVAQGWNVAVIFFILSTAAVLAATVLQKSGRIAMAVCLVPATFVFSAAYCHVRIGVPFMGASSGPSRSSLADGIALSPGFSFLPYRNAALLAAFVGGSTRRLPKDMRDAMERSGTSYLVGMYGYKLHLLAEAVTTAFAYILPRGIAIVTGLIGIACFVAAAGAPVSAVRAGIMIAFVSLAGLTGRRSDRTAALLLAAFLMIFWDPAVCGNAGFLLSFTSLAGIYLLAPALKACLVSCGARIRSIALSRAADSRVGRITGEIFGFHLTASAGVNLAILPIVARLDGSFPLISFASNVFAALPFGAMFGLGAGLALAGTAVPASSMIFASPLNAILAYETMVIRMTAALPLGVPSAAFPPFAIAAYYAGLAAFMWRFGAKGRRP